MKPALSLLTAILLLSFTSCQNNADEKASIATLTDSTSVTGLTGDSVKLVKTAGINFKVKNVEQSTRAVSSLAQKYSGMLTYENMENVEEGHRELKLSADSLMAITITTPRADITARIPSQNLEAFMFEVADLGYYTGSSKLQIDDKSLDYLENALKQKARAEVLSHASPGKPKSHTVLQTIAVRDEAIEQQMANKTIDADVNYSTVNLNLFQNAIVRKEIVANTSLDDYQLPFAKRLGNAFTNGWQFFLSFLIALVNLWMFIILGITVIISYKYWQQKRKPDLLQPRQN
jgi:hypothetical protein